MTAPIFVAGSGRSGTTIVGRTLALHPAIYALLDETRLLVGRRGALLDWAFEPNNARVRNAFLQQSQGGFWGREAVREVAESFQRPSATRLYRQLRHGGFYTRSVSSADMEVGLCRAVSLEHYRGVVDAFLSQFPQRDLEARLQAVARFCDDLFEPAVRAKGARRWSDDTPRNALYLRELSRVFPDLRVIHMVRDGRDVARSYSRLGWVPSRRQALHLWFEHVNIARRTGRTLGPERYREVVFERLIEDPERELRGIVEFLGESWGPEMDRHIIRREVSQRARDEDPDLDALFALLAPDLAEEYGWEL